jgi:hypothetical protein
MERGFWDIPIPADPTEVEPRTLIAPIVGYDAAGYRLGYGGGFFDRTLAKLGGKAEAIGIGWSLFQLETIHPQPHDVRMSAIVTETGRVAETMVRSSRVCALDEAPDVYAGFATGSEIAAALAGLRGALPAERQALVDYALWRLGLEATPPAPDRPGDPAAILAALLPRIRDDALHATLAALRATLPGCVA